MTNDKTKEISTQEQQEHLSGGQESPDMEQLREQWRKDGLMRDLINAIGGLCAQQFFTVQTFTEMCEQQAATTDAINRLITELRKLGIEANQLSTLRTQASCQQADDIHSVIHDDASVKVNTGLDDYAESIDVSLSEMSDSITSVIAPHDEYAEAGLHIEGLVNTSGY